MLLKFFARTHSQEERKKFCSIHWLMFYLSRRCHRNENDGEQKNYSESTWKHEENIDLLSSSSKYLKFKCHYRKMQPQWLEKILRFALLNDVLLVFRYFFSSMSLQKQWIFFLTVQKTTTLFAREKGNFRKFAVRFSFYSAAFLHFCRRFVETSLLWISYNIYAKCVE